MNAFEGLYAEIKRDQERKLITRSWNVVKISIFMFTLMHSTGSVKDPVKQMMTFSRRIKIPSLIWSF